MDGAIDLILREAPLRGVIFGSFGEDKLVRLWDVETGKFLSVSEKVGGEWLYWRDTWNADSPPPQ